MSSRDRPSDTAILTVDLEDWNQLVARQIGRPDWDRAGAAFPRQVEAMLAAFARLGARATFFVLGVTARRYPDAVASVARSGHAIASHGDAHHPVWQQSKRAFCDDLRRSIDAIGECTGARPTGYRAPAFSIRAGDGWAYEALAELGFAYDSSQHDSPTLPSPSVPEQAGPHELRLGSGRALFEFPPAVLRWRYARVPFGGGTYWRVLPERAVRAAIASHLGRGVSPTLYFHPYEFDPQPLRLDGASAARALARELRYNFRRRDIGERFGRLAAALRFIACEDYLEQYRRAGQASFS